MYLNKYKIYLKDNRRASVSTIQAYSRDVKQFGFYIYGIGVKEYTNVNKSILGGYLMHMQKDSKANSSILRTIASLRSFYGFMVDEGFINSDPTIGLQIPKAEEKSIEVLSTKDIENLLEQPLCIDFKGFRDKAMLELLYATGVRVSELLDLNMDDLYLDEEYIVCGQGHKRRIIPVGNAAIIALKSYFNNARMKFIMDDEDSNVLFVNLNGKRLTRQGFWKILKQYKEKANISINISPHTLRHTFAVHLIENGADMDSVKEMLGHSDLSTTKMYSKVVKKRINDVYKKAHPRA